MNAEENYLEINKQNWDKRVDSHVNSDFYNTKDFLKGETSLNEIEISILPELENRTLLHLQCHFGQDTISLARMGAKSTGVDFSPNAIEKAKDLAKQCSANADFICSDIYGLPEKLDGKFDVVFSSYGTIGWLPDINKWAKVVSHFLKPGGHFIFAEFHPVVWMFDNDLQQIIYRYFKSEAIVEKEEGSYADRNSQKEFHSVTWNYGLSQVIEALLQQGLRIEKFLEYDYSPYNIFPGMAEFENKKFRVSKFGDKIPLVYSLRAVKE